MRSQNLVYTSTLMKASNNVFIFKKVSISYVL
jgi:hypothetical protein